MRSTHCYRAEPINKIKIYRVISSRHICVSARSSWLLQTICLLIALFSKEILFAFPFQQPNKKKTHKIEKKFFGRNRKALSAHCFLIRKIYPKAFHFICIFHFCVSRQRQYYCSTVFVCLCLFFSCFFAFMKL